MADSNKQRKPQEPTRPNMHENVKDWDDTCSCEPEPRWQQIEDEQETREEKEDRADES